MWKEEATSFRLRPSSFCFTASPNSSKYHWGKANDNQVSLAAMLSAYADERGESRKVNPSD